MYLKDKTVLITGNGSFAKTMIERLLTTEVREVRVFSRNEENKWKTEKKFAKDGRVKMILGDITKYLQIYNACKKVDYVLHSAALKHVKTCEDFPIQAVDTNVNGSINVMQACIENNVERLVCLSTDKSSNASTCYGSTKYLMERVAKHIDSKNTTIVCTRYGNVLGSSGSVIPLFKQLREEGKPLTLTDPKMTRFFMPIKEAIDLVLYALKEGQNGDIIVHQDKAATVKMIADCISENQVVMGTSQLEKTDEALLTEQELNHSLKVGNFYIVRDGAIAENKFDKPLTSDNAERYDMKELKELIDAC